MTKTPTEKLAELVKELGVLRPRDLDKHGIPRMYLKLAIDRGLVERTARGIYVLSRTEGTEHQTLVECAKRVPRGVVCLLSALQFHDMTTQTPPDVWMAIQEKAWKPKVDSLPIHFVYFSGVALTEGIETHRIQNVPVRVYNSAKTVADCFKYRGKIGLDVAIEALRDCQRKRKCSNDELWRYAKVCRVANVMRPYLEAMA